MNKQTMKSGRCLVAVLILALILSSSTGVQAQDLQWAKPGGGANLDQGSGIAVDASGNSYVTGIFSGTATFGSGEVNQTILTSAGNFDIFVASYSSSGNLLWAKRAGGTGNDLAHGISIDGSGNVYVTGSFSGSATFGPGEASQTILTSNGSDDIFAARYDSSGVLQWAKRAGGTGSDLAVGIVVDGPGNVYVTGYFVGTSTFGPGEAGQTILTSTGNFDLFVAGYGSGGDLQWAKRAGGTDNDLAQGIAVDGLGNVYVTGRFSGTSTFGPGEAGQTILTSAGNFDIFVTGYTSGGDLLWAKRAGGTGSDLAIGIAVHASGVYATGRFSGSATFGPGEANQNILTSAGSDDIFVARYESGGDLLWAKQAGGINIDVADDIEVDGLGNSYVTGVFIGSATFGSGEANQTILTNAGSRDIFVARYDISGDLLWAKQFGGSNIDTGTGIKVDASGNSYVTGVFSGSAIFGQGEANQTVLTSAGDFDIFVAKLGSTAQDKIDLLPAEVDALLTAGAINSGQANGLTTKLQGATNKLNQGNTTAAINNLQAFINQVEAFINAGVLTATEGQPLIDAANAIIDQINNPLAKQGGVGDEAVSAYLEDFVLQQNYPNPFNPTTEIRFSVRQAGEVSLKIYNLRGQLIRTLYSNAITAGQHSVVWNGMDNQGNSMPSGIYFYKLEAGDVTEVKKMNLLK